MKMTMWPLIDTCIPCTPIKSKADFHIKWVSDCVVDETDLSPFLPVWATGEEAEEITGRSSTSFMSLTCSEKGNGGWSEWKGNVPFVRNGTPGGRKWAGGLWNWPLVSALGWPLRSIWPEMAGSRARCPQRACGPRRSIMGEEESGVGWGPAPTTPSHIAAQTARVNWLHPNKQANTDNSLVHNKQARSSYENFRKGFHCRMLSNLCIKHCITLNNWCECAYMQVWHEWWIKYMQVNGELLEI